MGIYVSGGSDGHITRNLEYLNLLTNQWKQLEPMKHKREEHGFTIGPDNKLYAIGGFNGKHCLNTAERYNIQTNEWAEIAHLGYHRRSLSAVALPDGVYALGGYDGENYLNTVEKYDIEKNEWVIIEPLNQARCTMAGVSSLDCSSIYAMGGYNGSPLNFVERYDAMALWWTTVQQPYGCRCAHSPTFKMSMLLCQLA